MLSLRPGRKITVLGVSFTPNPTSKHHSDPWFIATLVAKIHGTVASRRLILLADPPGGGEEDGVGGGQAAGSWAEWAWSAVPSPMSMLPIAWDDPEEDGDAGARLAAHERVVHFSVYVQQVDSVFKVSCIVR